MAVETVNWRGRHFPFNAAQTVNILGEVGPLFAMFVVNGLYGITAGAGALIVCTIAALIACLAVLGRPPIMPFIAGTVSIVFATLTFVTGDAVWVQIKVTLFNALVAVLLWWGLRTGKSFFRFVFGSTFHYTEEGWYKLTRNVALFFLLTAVINEAVRLGFADAHITALNHVFTGVDIWILFKIFVVMPLTAVFFWWQVRVLQRYRLPAPVASLAIRSDHLA